MHIFKHSIHILLYAMLMACTGIAQRSDPGIEVKSDCDGLFEQLELEIQAQGVMDAKDRRIEDFPYLRVDRFLSSFRNEVEGASLEQWLDLLQERGLSGWSIEYANLKKETQKSLWWRAANIDNNGRSFNEKLRYCSNQKRGTDFMGVAGENALAVLRQEAVVKDNYSLLKRSLGLYPLTALAFRKGIADWHTDTRRDYATPLSDLKYGDRAIAYAPAVSKHLSRASVENILRQSAKNQMRIPIPNKQEREALLSTYAPRYLVEQINSDDYIGFPFWAEDQRIQINPENPSVFTYLSWTRFYNQVLLQLNYLAWFPARTAESRFDILAGDLDGLLWRVTLWPDGEPLIYDSIHACGCYHLFFKGQMTGTRAAPKGLQEPDFFPSQQPYGFTDMPLSLYISTGKHYLHQVLSQPRESAADTTYTMHPVNLLLNLPFSNEQHRSLYQPDGLVQGTERPERFMFWPMGISSAGAMRQSGHHATAFVGRRHFDDARLFESIISRSRK